MVVWNIFYFLPQTLGTWSNSTRRIFVQMGWFNHQLVNLLVPDFSLDLKKSLFSEKPRSLDINHQIDQMSLPSIHWHVVTLQLGKVSSQILLRSSPLARGPPVLRAWGMEMFGRGWEGGVEDVNCVYILYIYIFIYLFIYILYISIYNIYLKINIHIFNI